MEDLESQVKHVCLAHVMSKITDEKWRLWHYSENKPGLMGLIDTSNYDGEKSLLFKK